VIEAGYQISRRYDEQVEALAVDGNGDLPG